MNANNEQNMRSFMLFQWKIKLKNNDILQVVTIESVINWTIIWPACLRIFSKRDGSGIFELSRSRNLVSTAQLKVAELKYTTHLSQNI